MHQTKIWKWLRQYWKWWKRRASRSWEKISILSKSNMVRSFHQTLRGHFCGYLVRINAITFKVDTPKLLAHISLLKDQILITNFVGPRPHPQDMKRWLQTLNHELRGNLLTSCRIVEKWFFLLGEDRDALNNAMMLSPFKTKWGTCMFLSWVLGFNLADTFQKVVAILKVAGWGEFAHTI